MIVIVIDNASETLRGELTRWILETKPGVFVGKVTAVVREKLWDKVCNNTDFSGALLLYDSNSEQGFSIKMCGEPKRSVINVDGIQLIKTK